MDVTHGMPKLTALDREIDKRGSASSGPGCSSSRRASRDISRTLDRADRDPTAVTEARVEHLKQKVEAVKAQMQRLKQIGEQLADAPDGPVSLTDRDARSMTTSGRGTGIVGYNVQTAVDAKHHLIVAHEVTNVGQTARGCRRWPSKPARRSVRTS